MAFFEAALGLDAAFFEAALGLDAAFFEEALGLDEAFFESALGLVFDVESVGDVLEEKCNYERYGNEILYGGIFGRQMEVKLFIGPTYYQRLKHMVKDKIHSRSANGPIILLTRQPTEGRAREGGLRLGEMEVECSWGHGSLHFLKERLMECSDNYRLFVCKTCGNIANVNPTNNIYSCKVCKNNINFSQIRIPYACKLLFQEIQAMSINTKFITN